MLSIVISAEAESKVVRRSIVHNLVRSLSTFLLKQAYALRVKA